MFFTGGNYTIDSLTIQLKFRKYPIRKVATSIIQIIEVVDF